MILPRKPPLAHDLDILARTIYGEARGEGNLGMEAVGCTIINRWKSGKWFNGYDTNNDGAESIAEVCQQRVPKSKWYQYSCWNEDNPGLLKMMSSDLYDSHLSNCFRIALLVIVNSNDQRWQVLDKSNGATHYYSDRISTPSWALGKEPCQIIGHHRFFKDIK